MFMVDVVCTGSQLAELTYVIFRIISFGDYVEELGHPYMWVQNLGGLHFPSDASEVRVC